MNQKYLDKLEQLDWTVNEDESQIELEILLQPVRTL